MEILDAIKTRRSVRRFEKKPVEEEKIVQVFEAARWAPSWANTQCARYTLVTDDGLREGLVATLPDRNPARQGALGAPCIVAVSARRGMAGCKKGEAVTDKGDGWTMFDAGLAVQNLTLAAHALGLGTVQVGYFDAAEAARLLGLPEDEVMVELIPMGYPAETPKAPPRLPLEEILRRR